MNVKIVSTTLDVDGLISPENLIVDIARVSNPSNQGNHQTAPRLIKYLIDHKHWSPFEMVDITFEITTSRAIAAQILRHRSFSFQEFSQRYAEVQGWSRSSSGSRQRRTGSRRRKYTSTGITTKFTCTNPLNCFSICTKRWLKMAYQKRPPE